MSALTPDEMKALNASVVLAAIDDMLAPWTLHRGAHLSALKHRLRRLRKHVAEHVRPAPTDWEYGRRHRETGRIAPLRGKPFPDWWGESQAEWEHVRRPAGGWSPVPEGSETL